MLKHQTPCLFLQSFFSMAVVFLGLVADSSGQANETINSPVREKSEEQQLSDARMKAMVERVGALRATDEGGAIPLIKQPLFRYTDPIRKTNDGIFSAWGKDSGRPKAIIGLFTEPISDSQISWAYEFISLTESGFQVSSGEPYEKFVWKPEKSELTWKQFPTAPTKTKPSSKIQMRSQLKALSAKFRVKEELGGLHQLRRLPKAIHEYVDDENDVRLGAVFSFAHGTNPEAILFVECRQKADASGVSWHYAFARATAAEVWAELDGTVVWQPDIAWKTNSHGDPKSSYFMEGARSAPIRP